MEIKIEDFEEIDIRVGFVKEINKVRFKKNYYLKIKVDFGPNYGERTTVLKYIENLYDDLSNRLVIGVVNIEPKKITGIISNVLLLGADGIDENFSLLIPHRPSRIGSRIY